MSIHIPLLQHGRHGRTGNLAVPLVKVQEYNPEVEHVHQPVEEPALGLIVKRTFAVLDLRVHLGELGLGILVPERVVGEHKLVLGHATPVLDQIQQLHHVIHMIVLRIAQQVGVAGREAVEAVALDYEHVTVFDHVEQELVVDLAPRPSRVGIVMGKFHKRCIHRKWTRYSNPANNYNNPFSNTQRTKTAEDYRICQYERL
ncbi:uncharacterized protein LOC144432994 [Glandiceps talaboti]